MKTQTHDLNTHPTTKWDGVALDEYNGVYGLIRMRKGGGNGGTWYKQWAFLAMWNKGTSKNVPGPKSMPISVRLGDKATAIDTLTKLLQEVQRG